MDQESILRQAVEAAKQAQGQPQNNMVPPMPVPMSVQLTSGQGMNGEKFVILVLQTPVGQHVYHFDPDAAERLAEGLAHSARVAKTGLEVPTAY